MNIKTAPLIEESQEESNQKQNVINFTNASYKIKKIDPLNKSLTDTIINLVSTYKLTPEEISGYLVEKKEINETEAEIDNLIQTLIQNQKINIIDHNNEKIIQPIFISSQDEEKWSTISREESCGWINQNTTLNDFFLKCRKNLNNIIKKIEVKNQNCYYLALETSRDPMQYKYNSKKFLMLSSNDYLGFSKHPEIIDYCKKMIDLYGVGACGSRVSIGNTTLHETLEYKIAKFKRDESSMVYSSGYLTNLAFLENINKGTVVFYDSYCHACIIDGLLHSDATPVRFKHNNLKNLEQKLNLYKHIKNKLIYVESVYSLEGDLAPLPDIIKLAKQFNAYIAIDEAHSTGAFGLNGKGIIEHYKINPDDIKFKIGTLSKAIGVEGGFICSKKRIIESFKYSTSPFLFTTGHSIPAIASAIKAFELLEEHADLAYQLQQKAAGIRNTLNRLGFNTGSSQSQIIPIMISDDNKVFEIQKKLHDNGYFIISAVYPTVPPKKSRLRLNISLSHTDGELNKFIEILEFYGKKIGII